MIDDKALTFDGTVQSMNTLSASGTLYNFNIDNTWSVMITVKPTSVAGTHTYFHLSDVFGDTSDSDNMIEIESIDSTIRFTIIGSKGWGGKVKLYDYDATITGSQWFQFIGTWDGQVLNLYKNGIILNPNIKIIDDNLVQTSSIDKGLMVGDSFITQSDEFQGNLYSAAIWNTTLIPSEISSIWNSGVASGIDLSVNFSSYQSSVNLQHWYRLGLDATNVGKDFGLSSQLANLSSLNVDMTNITTDFPGI